MARRAGKLARKVILYRGHRIVKVPGIPGYTNTVYGVNLWGGIEELTLRAAKQQIDLYIDDQEGAGGARENPLGTAIAIAAVTAAAGALAVYLVQRFTAPKPAPPPPKPLVDFQVNWPTTTPPIGEPPPGWTGSWGLTPPSKS